MNGHAYQSFIMKNLDVIKRICEIFKKNQFLTYTTNQLTQLLMLDDDDSVNLEEILRMWTCSLSTFFAEYGNLCQNERNSNWVWLKHSRDFYPKNILETHYRQFTKKDIQIHCEKSIDGKIDGETKTQQKIVVVVPQKKRKRKIGYTTSSDISKNKVGKKKETPNSVIKKIFN